jgi:NAD(P)-dependent dehydrogenase (short-subunit alcohol dehydrogenase family)
MPGAIDETGMFREGVDPEVDKQVLSAIPLGRTGKPVDVSNVVVFLVSDYSAYVTGTEQVLDGGHRT